MSDTVSKKEVVTLTEFTAGGNNDADIATPTKEPWLFPNTDRATAIPEAKAITAPVAKLLGNPLLTLQHATDV